MSDKKDDTYTKVAEELGLELTKKQRRLLDAQSRIDKASMACINHAVHYLIGVQLANNNIIPAEARALANALRDYADATRHARVVLEEERAEHESKLIQFTNPTADKGKAS